MGAGRRSHGLAIALGSARRAAAAADPHVLWVVGLFALLYPVPLASGRALFAPELTPPPASLLDTDPTLRIAALNDVSTLVPT